MAYITSLAFADDAFENTRFTLKLLYKLKVPDRLYILPLRFKKNILNTLIFRSIIQIVSSVYIYSTRPMLYRIVNNALKRLGEIAEYRYPIYYYCFRR
jgi:hypothetical protein